MIRLENLHLSFGLQEIYDGLTCTFSEDCRIGLVGRNGSGKSTLLKIIAGAHHVDEGIVSIPKNMHIAYMPQDVVIQSTKPLIIEALRVFEEIGSLLERKEHLEQQLAHKKNDALIDEYATICSRLTELDALTKKAEAERILMGLGFKKSQLHESVAKLSGGWKMRLVLAKLLLSRADFYLFDEPTNHLDIVAKDWFISFLKKEKFGFIMVSHERYILNELSTKTIEIENAKATLYNGNFSFYEGQKEQIMRDLYKAFEQQQREIKSKMTTVERFKAKSSKAAQAKSMLKKIEKMEKITLPPQPPNIAFSFPSMNRANKIVLKLHDVKHQFGKKEIFKNINTEITRGERVALVAANGVGKTTLFNLIAHKLPLQAGAIELGSQIQTALFEQEQDYWLDSNVSILENLKQHCSRASEQRIRALLGTFLLSGDDVNKKTTVLSGGEKSRVGIVRLLLQNANFLLLDEPTNHLDIPSKDILLRALQVYEGTMFFVSHDHDFINKLAKRIIELKPDGLMSYHGNYDDYLYTLAQQQEEKVSLAPENKPYISKQNSNRRKINALERQIDKLEKEKCALEEQFLQLHYGTQEFDHAQKRLQEIQKNLELLLAQWEEKIEQLS